MIARARYSIQSKLTLVFVLFAVVLLAGVGVFAYASGRGSLEAATISELLATAIEKQAALDQWTEEKQADIATLATEPAVIESATALVTAPPDSSEARVAHARLVAAIQPRVSGGEFLTLTVLEPDTGQVMAATDPSEERKFKEDRPFFVNGKIRPYVQNLYYSVALRGLAMTAAAPLRAPDGRLLGVLAGRLDLDEISAIIQRRTGQRQTDDAYLVNTSNLFVTQPRFILDPAVLQLGVHTEQVRRCLAHDSGIIAADDYQGVPVLAVYRWLPEREMCLIVKMDQNEAFAPVRAFGQTMVVIGALTLLTASLLAIGLARTFTRPVLTLKDGVARFGQGDLAVRLPETRRDELGLLAREFNRMAAALAEKDVQLRDHAAGLERKVEERTAALRESEERFRSLYEDSTLGLYRTTIGSRILLANPALVALLGYSSFDELATRDLKQDGFEPAYERAQFIETIERAGQIKGLESSWTRRDGLAIFVRESARAIRDPQGKTLYYDGTVEDITEQKRAAIALKASEERYRSLFENMLNGLAYCQMLFEDTRSPDFVYLEVNSAFETLTGLKDVVGKKVSEVIPGIQESDRELLEIYGRVASTGKPERVETYVAALEMWFSISVYSPGQDYFVAIFDVITVRKQAEEALRESGARLAGIIDSAMDAIITLDNSQGVILFNAAAEKMFRCPAADAVGQPIERFIPERFRTAHREHIRYFDETGITTRSMGRLRPLFGLRADGEEFPIEASISQIIVGGQKLLTVILRDITERKQAEQQIKSLARFPAENPNPVLRLRPDGVILYANEASQAILQEWGCAVGDDAPPVWRAAVAATFAERTSKHLDVQAADRVWSFFITPVIEAGYINLHGRDITERQQMENEIRQLNVELEQRVAQRTAELSDLYNNAPCGYHSLDNNGMFVRINDTELEWLGYTREEIIGKMKAPDLFTPASVETFNQTFPVFRARGWLRDLELDMVRKDGSILPVLLSATVIADQDGRYLMSRSTMIDHTDRKRAESHREAALEAMRVSQAQLEAANHELEAFSYSVSHDLRAPLRAMDGFSRILLEEYAPQLDAGAQRYLQIVRANAQQMGHLIDDLLTFSRLGRQPLNKQLVDMNQLVRQALGEVRRAQPDRSPELVSGDLPPCQADPALLKQVWVNLLSNAFKFTYKRGQARIELGCQLDQPQPIYFVRDNGAGFDMQYADKLFGVFQRFHRAEEYEGTGVGLAIVKRVVDRHGGRIWAEAQVDGGATFYFTI